MQGLGPFGAAFRTRAMMPLRSSDGRGSGWSLAGSWVDSWVGWDLRGRGIELK